MGFSRVPTGSVLPEKMGTAFRRHPAMVQEGSGSQQRTTTSQKREAVPGRARTCGSKTLCTTQL